MAGGSSSVTMAGGTTVRLLAHYRYTRTVRYYTISHVVVPVLALMPADSTVSRYSSLAAQCYDTVPSLLYSTIRIVSTVRYEYM